MADVINYQVEDITDKQILCVFVSWVRILIWTEAASILQVHREGYRFMEEVPAGPYVCWCAFSFFVTLISKSNQKIKVLYLIFF